MERVVEIDGKKIKFKATNQTPLIYKKHFRKDFFRELVKAFNKIPNNLNSKKPDDRKTITENLNTTFMYEMVWTLAKTADPKLPKMQKWLQTMPEVSVIELAAKLSDMIPPLVESKGRR